MDTFSLTASVPVMMWFLYHIQELISPPSGSIMCFRKQKSETIIRQSDDVAFRPLLATLLKVLLALVTHKALLYTPWAIIGATAACLSALLSHAIIIVIICVGYC